MVHRKRTSNFPGFWQVVEEWEWGLFFLISEIFVQQIRKRYPEISYKALFGSFWQHSLCQKEWRSQLGLTTSPWLHQGELVANLRPLEAVFRVDGVAAVDFSPFLRNNKNVFGARFPKNKRSNSIKFDDFFKSNSKIQSMIIFQSSRRKNLHSGRSPTRWGLHLPCSLRRQCGRARGAAVPTGSWWNTWNKKQSLNVVIFLGICIECDPEIFWQFLMFLLNNYLLSIYVQMVFSLGSWGGVYHLSISQL